jgi:sterol 14-demethylase
LEHLKRVSQLLKKKQEPFFNKWPNSGEIDMLEQMNKLTVLTASRCLLGPEIRENPKVSEEFARLYHDLEGI